MGRASMIMVMSYSTVLMMMGFNISKVSTQAYDNYVEYYERTVAHNVVNAGANMVAHQIWDSAQWRPGATWLNKSFMGGKIWATVTTQSDSTLKMWVRARYEGSTMDEFLGTNRVYEDTVIVVLQPSSFSKFSYYSNVEGSIWWTSGDTVWGPMHTQDSLGLANTPVFYGKVTSRNPIRKAKKHTAKFYGDYQSGVSIPLPTNLNPLETAAASNGRLIMNQNVTMTLKDDSATVKIGANPDTTVFLKTWAPNGAILVKGGNLRLKGTINTSLTVGAIRGVGQDEDDNVGKVYFDDDVKYKYDPRDYPDSTAMLGVVAEDSLVITENTANGAPDSTIVIQAALFSLDKGLGAQNYGNGNKRGKIELLGGITQEKRAAVGTFSGGVINSGYSKRYRYDTRLANIRPPFFPTTGSYEVLSWYEK